MTLYGNLVGLENSGLHTTFPLAQLTVQRSAWTNNNQPNYPSALHRNYSKFHEPQAHRFPCVTTGDSFDMLSTVVSQTFDVVKFWLPTITKR